MGKQEIGPSPRTQTRRVTHQSGAVGRPSQGWRCRTGGDSAAAAAAPGCPLPLAQAIPHVSPPRGNERRIGSPQEQHHCQHWGETQGKVTSHARPYPHSSTQPSHPSTPVVRTEFPHTKERTSGTPVLLSRNELSPQSGLPHGRLEKWEQSGSLSRDRTRGSLHHSDLPSVSGGSAGWGALTLTLTLVQSSSHSCSHSVMLSRTRSFTLKHAHRHTQGPLTLSHTILMLTLSLCTQAHTHPEYAQTYCHSVALTSIMLSRMLTLRHAHTYTHSPLTLGHTHTHTHLHSGSRSVTLSHAQTHAHAYSC